MVPEGWKATSLGAALDRVSRPVQVSPNQRYTQIGIRSHGRGLFIKEAIEGWKLGDKRVFHVEANCLVLNIVFAWEQAVGTTDKSHSGLIASHRFPMYRPRKGVCDIEFLRYLFLTPHGKHLLGLASPGGAGRNKTLGQKEFERLAVVLPPLSEQKKIAEILSTWDEAIETTEKLLANAEARKRALMQQLLTGKRRLKGFEGSEWRETQLRNIAKVIVSNVDKKSVANELPVRLCNYTDVYKRDFILPTQIFMKATATSEQLRKFRLKAGDVVITKDSETADDIAMPTYVAATADDLICGYHLAIVRPGNEADGQYLKFYFELPRTRHYFGTRANGAIRYGLTIDGIEGAEIRLPGIEEQKRIATVLVAAEKAISDHKGEIRLLKTAKTSLMQQLLTGKRRVTV